MTTRSRHRPASRLHAAAAFVARSRRALIFASFAAIAAMVAPTESAHGQEGTLHAQYARLDAAAHTVTLGMRYTKIVGSAGGSGGLPARGQVVERSGRRWLLTAMGGGGLARSRGPNPVNRFTLVGQAGALYRLESKVESLGVVAYANLEPGFIGPAATVRAFGIFEALGGVGKLEGSSGASWFLGAAVSIQLFGDLLR